MSQLDREARKVLDTYLKQVADAMRSAEHEGAEVDAVREGLREQILELATRDGATPNAAAIERAVASLDTPESYAPPAESAAPRWARSSGLARLSAVSCVLGAAIAVAVGFFGKPDYEDAGGGALVIAQLVALEAGAITWRDPWGRFGAVASGLLLFLVVAVALVHAIAG